MHVAEKVLSHVYQQFVVQLVRGKLKVKKKEHFQAEEEMGRTR